MLSYKNEEDTHDIVYSETFGAHRRQPPFWHGSLARFTSPRGRSGDPRRHVELASHCHEAGGDRARGRLRARRRCRYAGPGGSRRRRNSPSATRPARADCRREPCCGWPLRRHFPRLRTSVRRPPDGWRYPRRSRRLNSWRSQASSNLTSAMTCSSSFPRGWHRTSGSISAPQRAERRHRPVRGHLPQLARRSVSGLCRRLRPRRILQRQRMALDAGPQQEHASVGVCANCPSYRRGSGAACPSWPFPARIQVRCAVLP